MLPSPSQLRKPLPATMDFRKSITTAAVEDEEDTQGESGADTGAVVEVAREATSAVVVDAVVATSGDPEADSVGLLVAKHRRRGGSHAPLRDVLGTEGVIEVGGPVWVMEWVMEL